MSRHLAWSLYLFLAALIGWFEFSPLTAEETPNVKAPAAAEGQQATYLLQYKYEQANSVRYETVHNVKFVSQFKGTDETATNRTETRKRYTVVKTHPDGSADLELVIDWVRMKVNFGSGDPGVEFDSKDPAAGTQKKFADVNRIIGKPQATLLCAPNGKVLKRVLLKPAPEPGSAREIQLKEVTGEEDFLTIFPTTPLKIGETWTEKFDTKVMDDKLPQKINLKRTYKLESVEGNIATISFKTAILSLVTNPAISIQLIQMEPSGKLVFDMERGAVVTRTVDIDKTIIKPIGDNTAMHAQSHLFERMITETAEISDVPDKSTKK